MLSHYYRHLVSVGVFNNIRNSLFYDADKAELELLPLSALILTFECGMRFLSDHINGDVYFKIHREDHNLDRARCQLALAKDMIAHFDEMNAIVKKYL